MTDAYREFSALMGSGKFRQAAELATQELAHGGGAGAFWLTRRASALNRASDYEQAFADSRNALAIEPSNPYAILCAADALLGLQRPQEALGHYREIAAHAKVGGRAHNGIFESLAALGRWQELLDSLAAVPPEERHPWRVKALHAQGKTEEAMSECRQWLAVRPDHPAALWELSELEVASDGLETVRARYERLARIPTLPPSTARFTPPCAGGLGSPNSPLRNTGRSAGRGKGRACRKSRPFSLQRPDASRKPFPSWRSF